MDTSTVYLLHRFFSNRRYPAPLNDILRHCEISKSTFHKYFSYMRDILGAPIKNKRGQGYFYDLKVGETYELPGFWFSAKEIASLALLEQLSEAMQPALFKELLQPVAERLQTLLKKQNIASYDWRNRIKVLSQWQRECESKYFIGISQALLTRKQLEIEYWQWKTDIVESRIISPQRLIHYRDNWLLDAWCHKREALRTFSLNSIKEVKQLELNAKDIHKEILDKHVMSGYGIFAGNVIAEAKLKFSPEISRRVEHENWHPEQTMAWTAEHELLLTIPYSDHRELLRDILHYGNDVEVLAPESLRQSVKETINTMQEKYV